MAVVFRARDEMLGRPAAVKVLGSPMAGDPDFRARFLAEARAVAALKSGHILPVYGAAETEGNLYIATRWVAGGDLAVLASRAGGFLAPERAAALVAQVASALDAAHTAGLVHGDVKLQNILIDSTPERPEHAFLYGFRLGNGTGAFAELTTSTELAAIAEDRAPEQARADAADGRADQYALGCVAYTLLTGQAPLHHDDTEAMPHGQLNDQVPSPRMTSPELPPAVTRVLERALAESPADRYARCGEFAAAFQAALTEPEPQPEPEPHAVTVVSRQPLPAEGDTVAALPKLQPPRHPSPVPPAIILPEVDASALRESSTTGAGRGNAYTWPPRQEEWERPQKQKKKRPNGRTAVIAGTVAVALAAAGLIYAAHPTSSSGSTASSTVSTPNATNPTVPSGSAANPSTQPNGATNPATQPRGAAAAGAGQTAGANGPSNSNSHPASSPGQPGTTGTSGTTTTASVPAQVTGLTATPSDGSVALTWQAPQGSPAGYQVEVSPAPATEPATQQVGTATSDTVTGLTDGTTYTFNVLATNTTGNGPLSIGVTAVPFGKPPAMAAPTAEALPASATGAGSNSSATITTIRVTVNYASAIDEGSAITDYTWYEYKSSSSDGPWTEVTSQTASIHATSMVVPAGVALFNVSNDGSWYEFTTTATNAAGESPQSPRSSPAIEVTAPATTTTTATP
jgi:serine/threonine protein kinase